MMRGRARLQANQTRRLLLEKPEKLTAPQLTNNDRLPQRINSMNLKNGLRDIQTNRANPDYSRLGVIELVSMD
jgi:hypothetical protein